MKKPIKIWRSAYSHMGALEKKGNDLHGETVTSIEVYSDEVLSSIADAGFNGIWIYGILKDIVPSKYFSEFGRNSSVHIKNVNRLIDRAAKYGVKVYLLMQPPRAVDAESDFWAHHKDIGGGMTSILSDDGVPMTLRSLCTSTDQVKNFLFDSSAAIAQSFPDLGGVILITASEYPSHCIGRTGRVIDAKGGVQDIPVTCSRCRKRSAASVVSEIITLVRNGIRSCSSDIDLIAWNWSWSSFYEKPYREILALLPDDIIIMSGFERGGRKQILGKERPIDEYSLSYPGPSDTIQLTAGILSKRKMRLAAKLQIGTTHELATVPNIPVIGTLYEKVAALRKMGIRDFLGSWSFGNMLSANTSAFNFFMDMKDLPDRNTALKRFAAYYFPGCRPDFVVEGWNAFSRAMDYYPFSLSFLYSGPLNYTLAYPLNFLPVSDKPSGRSWLMDHRGDNLDSSLLDFSIEEVISALQLLSENWRKGVDLFNKGLEGLDIPHAREERDTAGVCYHVFRSALNTYRVYQLRKNFSPNNEGTYKKILRDELENLEAVLPVIKRDKRFGFHSEAQDYMFSADTVQKKMENLRSQL